MAMTPSERIANIKAQAKVEPDGWYASNDGRDLPARERLPQVLTYYKTCPKIACDPATIVERADVLWLTARVEELTSLLRDAYHYTPECTRIAEDIAALFPDIARPRDV